jgi:hypothetical protein
MRGCSMLRAMDHCVSRTESGRSAGALPRRRAGLRGFRVHDLRHTTASVWLAAGADPKVVQRVLGHATAAMTMDLYGHMVDAVCGRLPGLSGTSRGHLSRLKGRSRIRTTRSQAEVLDSGRFTGGAAYRNRTDDLRITRGMRVRFRSATCANSTANYACSADCTGYSWPLVPRPVPAMSARAPA